MVTSIKRRAKATFRITTSSDGDSFDRTVGRKALLHAARQRIEDIRYAMIVSSNFTQQVTWTHQYANVSVKF